MTHDVGRGATGRLAATIVAWGLAAGLVFADPAASQTPDESGPPRPAGVGMVRPIVDSERPLFLYASAGGGSPLDSLVFAVGDHSIELSYAPPWFVPDHLKLDYDLILVRAETLTRDRVEVVVNETEARPRFAPRTAWVDRDHVEFRAWPEMLLDVYAVELSADERGPNPIRTGPGDRYPNVEPAARRAGGEHLPGASDSGGPWHPVAVSGDWIEVEAIEAPEPGGPIGWIRWRRDGILLVRLVLLS